MVNATEWINQNYPINGTCQRQEDKENYGKTRKEIKNLNIVNQNLEGDLDLSVFPNLIKLELETEKQLNIKFPSHEVKVLAISTDSKSDVLKTQFQELDKKITYLKWRIGELLNFIRKSNEDGDKELEDLSKNREVLSLVKKLIEISIESTTLDVKDREHESHSPDYREKSLYYEKKIREVKDEIETKVDEETMEKILRFKYNVCKSTEWHLELESKRKEKEELIRQLKEVQSQIQITPK